jgi:hypothetical protein
MYTIGKGSQPQDGGQNEEDKVERDDNTAHGELIWKQRLAMNFRKLELFILLGGLIALVLGLMTLAVILARRARPTMTATGELVMRYPLVFRLLSLFGGVAIPVRIGVVFIIGLPQLLRSGLVMCVVGGVFWTAMTLGAEYLLLETFTVRVLVSEGGITFRSWLRRCAYSWDEITEVYTLSWVNPFVFCGSDGQKFTVPAYLTNVPLLVTTFRTHLAPRVYSRARRGIEWHG